MTLEELSQWVDNVFPTDSLQVPRVAPDERGVLKAAANVIQARRDLVDPKDRNTLVLLQGLNGFGVHLFKTGAPERAALVFSVVHEFSDQVEAGRYASELGKASEFAAQRLQRTGHSRTSGLPEATDAPWIDLRRLLEEHEGDLSPGSTGTPSFVSKRAVHRFSNFTELITVHSQSWILTDNGGVNATDLAQGLLTYLNGPLGASELLTRDLGRLLETDIRDLATALPNGALPSDRASLQALTREARSFAFSAHDDLERRGRWMLSCLANYALWKVPDGLSTNHPQVLIDMMGYLGAVLMERRYNDADRDLLLDCAEAVTRVAHQIPPVVFARFDYVRDWLLTSVGTYLLLAGPDQKSPSESYYDERIQSDNPTPGRGLRRAERNQWAHMLLADWRNGPADKLIGASYSLASLAGWDESRVRWVIDHVFAGSADARASQDSNFWQSQAIELLARVDRVRVTANPWNPQGAGDARDSMITSDSTGRLSIPTAVLMAAASQGLESGDIIVVHGQLFAGRRVPTYLLTNRFGPHAILKLEYADKVMREVSNFNRFALRLHQNYRPSDCVAHPLDMHLGEDGAPLRAIQTSYVFDEEDQPLTLAAWIGSARPEDASLALHRLFLVAMRPWLAHVRRERIDIRAEYPSFRPSPAPDKQSPSSRGMTEREKVLKTLRADHPHSAIDFLAGPRTEGWEESISLFEALPPSIEGQTLVNPIWLASELAEIGDGLLGPVINSMQIGLRDFETLLALSHGDLHLDNVLCTASVGGLPKTVLIDFESTHYGHICKDPARVEASMMCQVFSLTRQDAALLVKWFAETPLLRASASEPLAESDVLDTSDQLRSITLSVNKLREITAGCGQQHWPVSRCEYLLALLGALLPMTRYSTLSKQQRELAFCLACAVSTALLAEWKSDPGFPESLATNTSNGAQPLSSAGEL